MNILNQASGEHYQIYNGDCVEVIKGLPDSSIDFSVFSPPFGNLYIYSDSPRDMGNTEDHKQFFEHFDFLIVELYRILKPGRLVAVHCKDLPLYMNRDGAAGLFDFPAELVRHFEMFNFGHPHRRFVKHSEVAIWKDPVIEMQRTHNHGLLHKNFAERSEVCRQGVADKLLVFRKWTENEAMPDKQVQHKRITADFYRGTNSPQYWDSDRDLSIQVWQRYASPVWMDIDQTNVLNFQVARANEDEKHICPLQLDVIARTIQLWTNPGEVVFTPFLGIGSEVYEAIKLGRRGIGIELKPEYFNLAVKHCDAAEFELKQPTIFELLDTSNATPAAQSV